MSPLKKGTKLTENPKDTMFRVRFDKETVDRLEYIARETNQSKTDVVRNGINEQYLRLKKEN